MDMAGAICSVPGPGGFVVGVGVVDSFQAAEQGNRNDASGEWDLFYISGRV
jgi:hypothetical protein